MSTGLESGDAEPRMRAAPRGDAGAPPAPILAPGRNCWRKVQTSRLAFLVDAQSFFRAFKATAARAQRQLLILSWDVDSRTRLDPGARENDLPDRLGPFLNAVVSERPDLHAYVLNWDFSVIYALERQFVPQFEFGWRTHPRLHFALDDEHPVAASHHQKVVVVDDAVAFTGGLDLTIRRWDTPEHRAGDKRRVDPHGRAYEPFHDVQIAVEGEAAACLGELARERWKWATREELPPPAPGAQPWPAQLQPDLENVEVAIARTLPPWKDRPAVKEVEALYLDSIAAARHSIYIENQYLSSTAVARALAKRLEEKGGPEVVIVLPGTWSGWLEETSVGVAQARLVRRLRECDRDGRLRIYSPMVPGKGARAVKVHAKVMVVDDRFVRVGSSNLTNRSMGLDTECDIAIEGDDEPVKQAITGFRDRLLAEHLGASPQQVAAAVAEAGSLVTAVDHLCGGPRTLKQFTPTQSELLEEILPPDEILDPPAPLEPERIAENLVRETYAPPASRATLYRVVALLAALVGLAALWRWGPLGDVVDVALLESWGRALQDHWLAGPVVIGGFVLGGLVAAPVVMLITATVLLFGPVVGFGYALAGSLLSAAVCFAVGRVMGQRAVRRFANPTLYGLSRRLARRGVLSMAAIRMVPVAPFTVVNLVAGASHIGFRDFLLGTLIGMAPGILAMTVFAEQLRRTLAEPSLVSAGVLTGIVLALSLLALWIHRKLGRARD